MSLGQDLVFIKEKMNLEAVTEKTVNIRLLL